MKGTRLLLARHAETSAPDRFHGAESDIGLSEWGARQAELLGQSLKDPGASALYSSAMRRAVDTAAPIGRACALEPVAIAGLHERKIGPLSGLSREEGWATYAASKERWIAGDLEYSHPGGESYADIRRRVVPIFEDLAGRHRGETIIVVAHGVVIRVVLTTSGRPAFSPPTSTGSPSISPRSTTSCSTARTGRPGRSTSLSRLRKLVRWPESWQVAA